MSRKPLTKTARATASELNPDLPALAPNIAARFFLLKVTLVAGICADLLMSRALWIGPRTFPLVPVSWMPCQMERTAAVVLYGALFVLALVTLFVRRAAPAAAAFVAIMLAFCLADQTRWQPWVFQYTVLMAVVALAASDGADLTGEERVLNLGRLIVAFTYIFSGLQKLNPNFMFVDFPWLVEPVTRSIPPVAKIVPVLGALAPFVQVGFGVGLLTRRWRRLSLGAAVAMHGLILAMFGPLGHNWNNVIWPWTAAMALFDIVLFSATSDLAWLDVLSVRRDPAYWAAFALFAVLPLLSFCNRWDSYLSAALYSGNLTEAQIYLSDAGRAAVRPALRRLAVHTSPNTNVLNIQRWAIEDLNVMPYPETRVYKEIARSVCGEVRNPGQLVLIIREQRLFGSAPESGFQCSEL
jgi:hypothetical protein